MIDTAIEIALEKIQQMKLEIEKYRNLKKETMEFKKKILTEKQKNFDEIIYSSQSKIFFNKLNGKGNPYDVEAFSYLKVALYCHEKLMQKEDEAVRDIFEEFNEKTGRINSEIDIRNLFSIKTEISNLIKEISILEQQIAKDENLAEDNTWIENLEKVNESHLESMKIAEEWHQRDLEAKVEQRIKEREEEQQNQIEILPK